MRVCAKETTEEFRPPRPEHPGDPEDLPPVKREGDIAVRFFAVKPLTSMTGVPDGGGSGGVPSRQLLRTSCRRSLQGLLRRQELCRRARRSSEP